MTQLLENKIIWTALLAWLVAQVLKVITDLIKGKHLNVRRFVGAGGMPSSHSSMVTALCTAVALNEGLGSTMFALSAVLAMIVMYDAAGVRRETGIQAKMLNWMAENWHEGDAIRYEKKLKEFVGHTPLEVLAGAILGVLIGFIVQ